jgi:two-component system, NtrC family, sensor kinase
MTAAPDPSIHRFVHDTASRLRDSADAESVLRAFVRAASEWFGADRAWVAELEPGLAEARIVLAHPAGTAADVGFATELLRSPSCVLPQGMVCARLVRRRRPWAAIVLEKDSARFHDGAPRDLRHVAEAISDRIERIDQARLAEIRARIDGKLMRELPPKDLYYQILDGLHVLTRYDHSAALWIWRPGTATLELVAEQIAWRKARSAIIGQTVALPEDLQALLGDEAVYGFDREGGAWREWTGSGTTQLAELLDGAADRPDRPPTGALLVAPLGSRQGPLGVLVLAEQHARSFGAHERDVLARFTLLASLALQRAETLEALQARMLKVERQGALADLARGVAHDINNAMGEVLPLVQQIRSDLEADRVDKALLAEDLERIEHALQVCRGIFGRMMRFARGSSRGPALADVRRAYVNARDVLGEGLAKQGIALDEAIANDLPPVACGPSDLERLFLNLMSNARDAMPSGGRLRIAATRAENGRVEVVVRDEGCGMDAETLALVERAFFTTKDHGTGLGLSTCRSIVSEAGGALQIQSAPGNGTTVAFRLPAAEPAAEAREPVAAPVER